MDFRIMIAGLSPAGAHLTAGLPHPPDRTGNHHDAADHHDRVQHRGMDMNRQAHRPLCVATFVRLYAFGLRRRGGRRHRLPCNIATGYFNRHTARFNFHFGICVQLRYQGGLYLQYSGDLILHFTKSGLNRLHSFPDSAASIPYQGRRDNDRAHRQSDSR